MIERRVTTYKRGVSLDGYRHAADPESPDRGLCGAVLVHRIGLFQVGHPLSCKSCADFTEVDRAAPSEGATAKKGVVHDGRSSV